jgi:O-antigen/teichoic acid export membrane protein
LFELPEDNVFELQLAMLIVGLGIALQFPLFPFSAIFPATERFDIANGIGILSRLLFAGATYLVLEAGYGLIGLCFVATGASLADYAIRTVVAFRLVPGLRVGFHLFDMSRAREFASFGIWNTVIQGSVRLISYSDAVVIGVFLPPAAITPFAVAGSLIEYFMRLFIPIGQVFFPRFAALDAKGDTDGIRELFLNGTRLLAVLACPAGLVTFWFANDFLELWIGDSVGEGTYPSAAALYSTLVLAAVFSATQRVTYQVFLGTRRLNVLAVAFLIEAVANLIISIALIGQFGLIGVALGTLIPAILVEGVVLPMLVCRSFAIQLSTYFMRTYGPALILVMVLLPLLIGVDQFRGAMSWGRLAIEGGLVVLATILLIPWVGLSGRERNLFIWAPINRLRNRKLGDG